MASAIMMMMIKNDLSYGGRHSLESLVAVLLFANHHHHHHHLIVFEHEKLVSHVEEAGGKRDHNNTATATEQLPPQIGCKSNEQLVNMSTSSNHDPNECPLAVVDESSKTNIKLATSFNCQQHKIGPRADPSSDRRLLQLGYKQVQTEKSQQQISNHDNAVQGCANHCNCRRCNKDHRLHYLTAANLIVGVETFLMATLLRLLLACLVAIGAQQQLRQRRSGKISSKIISAELVLILLLATSEILSARGQQITSDSSSVVRQSNPYLVPSSSSNSTLGYLERHNFGLRLIDQLRSDSDLVASQWLLSPNRVAAAAAAAAAADTSLQQMVVATNNRPAEPSNFVAALGDARGGRIARQLIGAGDNGRRQDSSANATVAAGSGWLLADDSNEDYDFHVNHQDKQSSVGAAAGAAFVAAGERKKSIVNLIYNTNNYTSGAANGANYTGDNKRDYETIRPGGLPLLQPHQHQHQPIAATRRDFITSFLSHLPGLASFRSTSGAAGPSRQPINNSSSAPSSFAAKLAARLRIQPLASAAPNNTVHPSNYTSDFFGNILPENNNLISGHANYTSTVADSGESDAQTKDYQTIVAYTNSSSTPVDWLAVQASDNIEQVIRATKQGDHLAIGSEKSKESGDSSQRKEGEHLKGYEQNGNWKKSTHGHDQQAASGKKHAKEGAKNLDDKGHNKHGWKNVYHREEYAQHSKFHDLYRDKNWDHSKGRHLETNQSNRGEKFNDTLAKNFYDIDKQGTKYDFSKGSQWKRQEDDQSNDDSSESSAGQASNSISSAPRGPIGDHYEASGTMDRNSSVLRGNQIVGDQGDDDDNDDPSHNHGNADGDAVIEQMKAKLDQLSHQQADFSLPGERLAHARNLKDILKIPKGVHSKTLNSSVSNETADLGDYSGGDGDDTSMSGGSDADSADRPVAKENRKNELRLKLELDLGKSVNGQRSKSRQRSNSTTTTTSTTTMMPQLQNIYNKPPHDHNHSSRGKFDHWQAKQQGGWKANNDAYPTKNYHSNYSGPANAHALEQQQQHHHDRKDKAASVRTYPTKMTTSDHSLRQAKRGSQNGVMLNAATLAQSMPSRPIIVKHLQMNGGIVMGRVSANPKVPASRTQHLGGDFQPMLIEHSEISPMNSVEESFAGSLADHEDSLEYLPASKHALYDMSYEPPAKSQTPREYLISFERGSQSSESHRHNHLRSPPMTMEERPHSGTYQMEQVEPNVILEAAPSEHVLNHERKPFMFADSPYPIGDLIDNGPTMDTTNDDFQHLTMSTANHQDRRPQFVDGLKLEPMLVHESQAQPTKVPFLSQHDQLIEANDNRNRQRQRQNPFVDLLRVAPTNYSHIYETAAISRPVSFISSPPGSSPYTPISPQAILGRLLRLPKVFGGQFTAPLLHSNLGSPIVQRPSYAAASLMNDMHRSPNFMMNINSQDLMGEASRIVTTRVKTPNQRQWNSNKPATPTRIHMQQQTWPNRTNFTTRFPMIKQPTRQQHIMRLNGSNSRRYPTQRKGFVQRIFRFP